MGVIAGLSTWKQIYKLIVKVNGAWNNILPDLRVAEAPKSESESESR